MGFKFSPLEYSHKVHILLLVPQSTKVYLMTSDQQYCFSQVLFNFVHCASAIQFTHKQ
jgi:hypothetical protein